MHGDHRCRRSCGVDHHFTGRDVATRVACGVGDDGFHVLWAVGQRGQQAAVFGQHGAGVEAPVAVGVHRHVFVNLATHFDGEGLTRSQYGLAGDDRGGVRRGQGVDRWRACGAHDLDRVLVRWQHHAGGRIGQHGVVLVLVACGQSGGFLVTPDIAAVERQCRVQQHRRASGRDVHAEQLQHPARFQRTAHAALDLRRVVFAEVGLCGVPL